MDSFMMCYEMAEQDDKMRRECWGQIRQSINYVENVAVPQHTINVPIPGLSAANRWVHKQTVEDGLSSVKVHAWVCVHVCVCVWKRQSLRECLGASGTHTHAYD